VEIIYFVALNALAHLAFVGSRMTTSLFALWLGASDLTVGLCMSLFAALPMLLSVPAGRMIDRVGPRRPLAVALAALVAGDAVPFLFPSIEALYVSSTLIGTAFMLVHIAMNSVIGAHGSAERRAVNFSWLALGFSISGSLGPIVAGVVIDWLGHVRAFAALAAFPAVALALLALRQRPLPRPDRHIGPASGVLALFRVPGLRTTFLVSGVLAMGWDLYSFVLPLYGARLGFSASTIGTVMATFALATFVVRLAMPTMVRRLKPWQVIVTALGVAGSSYLLFPLASGVPQLMALSFVLGLGLGCAQPVIMSMLYDASPPGRQSEAVGVRTSMMNASHTFIPLASGAISALVGMAPVFWLLAGSLLGAAWFVNQRVKSPAI
jgi:MFS family permease